MKGTEAQLDQTSATTTTTYLAMMLVTQTVMIAAMSSGKMQYPSRHIDWKKPMLPPNRTTLSVSTMAPREITPNTICRSQAHACRQGVWRGKGELPGRQGVLRGDACMRPLPGAMLDGSRQLLGHHARQGMVEATHRKDVCRMLGAH